MRTLRPTSRSAPDVAASVLGVARPERAYRIPLAGFTAFLAHTLVALAARHMTVGVRSVSPAAPALLEEIELSALQAPSPPPVAPEGKALEHRMDLARVRAVAVHGPRSAPVPVAQAAAVIARLPDSDTPVDLTADAVVTGEATAYAGGMTASPGTSTSPREEGLAAQAPGPAASSVTLDRSAPVSLSGENWTCPWPREADAEQIDEQTVVLRVVVNASGDAESATLVSDPGHGFGSAALACALRTRFTPALSAKGERIKAASPPIRIRFTR